MTPRAAETIAAIATAPGRAGVAVVRVSGPDAFAIVSRLTGRPARPGRISYRRVTEGLTPKVIDDCVVLAFAAPHSYTGEDVVEFQCHGGRVTPNRILAACFSAGARLARRGEFTARAFLNGRLDYDQAAAVLDLIDAKTVRAADRAREGLDGARRRDLRDLYEEVLGFSTELEYALDVDEGELPPDFATTARARLAALAARVRNLLIRAQEGRLLREGALVVLAGPPNAGKSSLMNALLGEDRVLVSSQPGTTRDSIEESLDVGGWPVRLVDTAGLRETGDAIEGAGVRRARNLIARADVILDLGTDCLGPNVIRMHAKCDLARGSGLNVSAKTGEGLDDLRAALAAKLAERVATNAEEPMPDAAAGDQDVLRGVLRQLATVTDAAAAKDPVLVANALHAAADLLGEALGAVYSDDLLDRLFSRFCVGK